MADLVRGLAEHDEQQTHEAPTKPDGPRELVLGVDVFIMPDGSYGLRDDIAAYARRPRTMSPEEHAQHQYGLMFRELERLGTVPPCRDDQRFIADPIPTSDVGELYEICDRCPVRGLCRSYANFTHPEAGYWGGRDFTRRTREEIRMLTTIPKSPRKEHR